MWALWRNRLGATRAREHLRTGGQGRKELGWAGSTRRAQDAQVEAELVQVAAWL